ncbi:MAG: transposase [Acutalibacter sp.]|nr:transposase [Acutalibacter sp.]
MRPYTPRHNGKVERSPREDQKRFYSVHSFFSLADFEKQLAAHNHSSNNLSTRPLVWLSTLKSLVQFVSQTISIIIIIGISITIALSR